LSNNELENLNNELSSLKLESERTTMIRKISRQIYDTTKTLILAPK